ncbi:MAG TPA: IS110 family transposase [Thermoanaerobaculia bacterium]|jgi:transposase|nr:IS110 family transposase [Thermoanaerobaculia bacterium]
MEWVACVGIDWGDKQHACMIQTRQGTKQASTFGNSPEKVHEWVRSLHERFPDGTIVVGVEQGQWSLIYALMAYEFLALVPINPRASKAYRTSLRLSGASDDPADAALICDFVLKHFAELRVWHPDDVRTRKMRLLCEQRRSLVDQRTALTHTLAATLKEYFPQVLEWFGETSRYLRAFLAHWPTLEQARQASADELTGMLKANRRRKPAAVAHELIEKIRVAVPLTHDSAIIEAHSLYALSLTTLIDPLDQQITKYDGAIAAAWASHPDRKIFSSLPGAGAVIAPRLAVAFGLDRSRYDEAREVQQYSGIAPVTEKSGKHIWIHARWGFPTFLHQTFHEFAQASLPKCEWARAFYQQQRNGGAGHHQAIRTLAFRWIRILFRLWKTGEEYDENRYIEALRQKQSPIVRRLAAA